MKQNFRFSVLYVDFFFFFFLFIYLFLFSFQGQRFKILFDFTAVSVKCRMATVSKFPVTYHNEVYIYILFGITEPVLEARKIHFRLSNIDVFLP